MSGRSYSPPFEITSEILTFCAEISRLIGRYEGLTIPRPQPQLRRQNRVRTIRGSLAIEGNTLSEDQITAIIEGKRVIGPRKDVLEVQNAIEIYNRASEFNYRKESHFLKAHSIMMKGLARDAGRYRSGGVGVWAGDRVAHVAPPAKRVPILMGQLFEFLKGKADANDLIKSAVFHYEIEFIHPFSDGNGRMGRFWQFMILKHFHPLFEWVPIESVIRQNQDEYYRVLGACDKSGQVTAFVAFSLHSIHQGLNEFLGELRPEAHTAESRLEMAKGRFGSEDFSRKDYLALFKTLSSATASRDLREGVERNVLAKRGDKRLTRYRFVIR